MNCPICGEELAYSDYFGRIAAHQDGKKCGDIYKCTNEECDGYEQTFYTCVGSNEVHEGYPC